MAIQNNDGPMAQINVTPLVDVMLVLLVIFMVTAPILQQGVEVNLPQASTAPLTGNSEQVVLSIDAAGKLFLGAGNAVAGDEVGAKVAAVLKNRPEEQQKIYIKADKANSYGAVMEVMGKLHDAGVHKISLVSESKGSKR